jgi:hypothetical protein
MVQAAHNMHLGGTPAGGLCGAMKNLFIAHQVATLAFQVGTEGAKDAPVNTNIGGIQVNIHIVIPCVSILFSANKIRQLAQGKEVGMVMQMKAILHSDAVAGQYLVCYVFGFNVIRLHAVFS